MLGAGRKQAGAVLQGHGGPVVFPVRVGSSPHAPVPVPTASCLSPDRYLPEAKAPAAAAAARARGQQRR